MRRLTKQEKLLSLGWLFTILAPLFMDWALNEQHDHLTLSEKVRQVEAAIPHGKTVGQAVLTGLFGLLSWHFHWQHRIPDQNW